MMIKDIVINKLVSLVKVLIFSLSLFGMIIIAAYIARCNYGNYDALSFVFIEQMLWYIGIITIGIIICLTDIILSKVSSLLRIVIFSIGLYISFMLMIYLNGSADMFKDVSFYILFTMNFIIVIGIISYSWYSYQKIISGKYNTYLEKFRNK